MYSGVNNIESYLALGNAALVCSYLKGNFLYILLSYHGENDFLLRN